MRHGDNQKPNDGLERELFLRCEFRKIDENNLTNKGTNSWKEQVELVRRNIWNERSVSHPDLDIQNWLRGVSDPVVQPGRSAQMTVFHLERRWTSPDNRPMVRLAVKNLDLSIVGSCSGNAR